MEQSTGVAHTHTARGIQQYRFSHQCQRFLALDRFMEGVGRHKNKRGGENRFAAERTDCYAERQKQKEREKQGDMPASWKRVRKTIRVPESHKNRRSSNTQPHTQRERGTSPFPPSHFFRPPSFSFSFPDPNKNESNGRR